jgi:hypothetical protein
MTKTNQERRTFLEDGEGVIFRRRCEDQGVAPIGFGQVRCTLVSA